MLRGPRQRCQPAGRGTLLVGRASVPPRPPHGKAAVAVAPALSPAAASPPLQPLSRRREGDQMGLGGGQEGVRRGSEGEYTRGTNVQNAVFPTLRTPRGSEGDGGASKGVHIGTARHPGGDQSELSPVKTATVRSGRQRAGRV
eukprot:3481840-Pyramimonas_sp.AAC.1